MNTGCVDEEWGSEGRGIKHTSPTSLLPVTSTLYTSTLKIEKEYSSEALVYSYETTQRSNSEDHVNSSKC
jgi:hypothetical protein